MVTRLMLPCLLLTSACFMAPNLGQYGYTSCKEDGDCAELGRLCESGFCTPPPWWDDQYPQRRQIHFTNTTGVDLPKGFPIKLAVGPAPRPLRQDEMSAYSRLVLWDRQQRNQVELKSAVDVLNPSINAFDVLFAAPVDLPVNASLREVWLYSGVNSGGTARVDDRKEIYVLEDDFEGNVLEPTVWATYGTVNFVPGDGQVVLESGGYLWSLVSLPPQPGMLMTVEFSVTPYASCSGLNIGLMAQTGHGLKTPYVLLMGTDGSMIMQVLRLDSEQTEPAQTLPKSMRNTNMRLDLLVSGKQISAWLDGVTLESFQTRSPVLKPLNVHFFVEGGACTLSVKKVRVRPAVVPDVSVDLQEVIMKPKESNLPL